MSRTPRRDPVPSRHTADAIHRAMYQLGEPAAGPDLAALVGIEDHRFYRGLEFLRTNGMVETAGVERSSGRPRATYALTTEGQRAVPDPTPHSQVGHSLNAPSLRPADPTDFRNHPHTATVVGETTRTQWPLLKELLGRAELKAKLVAAAEALPVTDPLRQSLNTRAGKAVNLTPLEQEYVAYHRAHSH